MSLAAAQADDGFIRPGLSSEEIESGKYKVCDDWVLIRRDDDETNSGVIVLPKKKSRRARAVTGVVVQVAEHNWVMVGREGQEGAIRNGVDSAFSVKVGDGVLFNVLAGHDIMTTDGQRYVQCVEHDIYLIFDNPEDRSRVAGYKSEFRSPFLSW